MALFALSVRADQPAGKSSEQVHFETMLAEARKSLPECDASYREEIVRLGRSAPGNENYFQESSDVQRALNLLESHPAPPGNYGDDISEIFVRQHKRMKGEDVFGLLLLQGCDVAPVLGLQLRLIGTSQQKPLAPRDRQRLIALVNESVRHSPRGPNLFDLNLQLKLLRAADAAELLQLNSTQERDLSQLEQEIRNRYRDQLEAKSRVEAAYAASDPHGVAKLWSLEVAEVSLARTFSARMKSVLRDVTTAASCEHEAVLSVETREVVLRAIREIFFEHNIDAVDRYLADAFIQNDPGIPIGKRAFKNYLRNLFVAFPDYTGKVDNLVVSGNLISLQLSWTGTHRGRFMGIGATGKKIMRRTADTYRVENGKIVEHWGVADQAEMLKSLGL
ncbi:MAG: ester cyclase [Bdellovibrionales bacterium]|nr:ester cyclase [Bdellovibrionales bacterium]